MINVHVALGCIIGLTYFGFHTLVLIEKQVAYSPIPVPVGSPPWTQNPKIESEKMHDLQCMTRDAKPTPR